MKFRKFNTEKFHELYDNACDLANKAEKELVKECKAELEWIDSQEWEKDSDIWEYHMKLNQIISSIDNYENLWDIVESYELSSVEMGLEEMEEEVE